MFALARMGTLTVVLLLLTVELVTAQVDFGDPCYLIPYTGTLLSGKLIDVEIPENCTIGNVDWNYPRGIMSLHLTRADSPYQLCLQGTWSTDLGGVSKVVNGVETVLPLPTRDSLSCTEDVDGKARLLVSATSYLLYMTEFAFRVVKPGSP